MMAAWSELNVIAERKVIKVVIPSDGKEVARMSLPCFAREMHRTYPHTTGILPLNSVENAKAGRDENLLTDIELGCRSDPIKTARGGT